MRPPIVLAALIAIALLMPTFAGAHGGDHAHGKAAHNAQSTGATPIHEFADSPLSCPNGGGACCCIRPCCAGVAAAKAVARTSAFLLLPHLRHARAPRAAQIARRDSFLLIDAARPRPPPVVS